MLRNIVDHRKYRFRWRQINAVAEATWHDNKCQDADISERGGGPDYAERERISIEDAIRWAHAFDEPVTLYLYDKDDGIYARKPHGPRKSATQMEAMMMESTR